MSRSGRMRGFMPNNKCPPIFTILNLSPITALSGRNINPLYSIGGTFKRHIIGFIWIRSPLCTICTAHTFVCRD